MMKENISESEIEIRSTLQILEDVSAQINKLEEDAEEAVQRPIADRDPDTWRAKITERAELIKDLPNLVKDSSDLEKHLQRDVILYHLNFFSKQAEKALREGGKIRLSTLLIPWGSTVEEKNDLEKLIDDVKSDDKSKNEQLLTSHKHTVGAVIRDNKVLLVKRPEKEDSAPGKWGLINESPEENEIPESTIIRGFKEELRVDFIIEKHAFNQKLEGHSTDVFIGDITGDIELNPDEVSEYGWFTYEEAIQLDLTHYYGDMINQLHDRGHI